MGEKPHAKETARFFLGLSFLLLLVLTLLGLQPHLANLLPAANLAYLLRDGNYLILFQNNNELRSSGGFIGSFAEVEVKGGRPGSIDFGTNIYKLDEPFAAQVVVPPPAPLLRITGGRWTLRDSNWAADFPQAAEQILWFYEREWGMAGKETRLDGVIALTTTVIEELLRLTDPIEMPAYTTTLTRQFRRSRPIQSRKGVLREPDQLAHRGAKDDLARSYPSPRRTSEKSRKESPC